MDIIKKYGFSIWSFVLIVVLVSSCKNESPTEKLHGKNGKTWVAEDSMEEGEGMMSIGFMGDGTFKITENNQTKAGTYTFAPETKKLELAFNEGQPNTKLYYILELENSKMILQETENDTEITFRPFSE